MACRSVGASSALYRHIVGGEIVSFFLRRLYCIGLEGLRPRILWVLPVLANHLFAHLDAHQPIAISHCPRTLPPDARLRAALERLLDERGLSRAGPRSAPTLAGMAEVHHKRCFSARVSRSL